MIRCINSLIQKKKNREDKGRAREREKGKVIKKKKNSKTERDLKRKEGSNENKVEEQKWARSKYIFGN